jgi:putative DNA methylase
MSSRPRVLIEEWLPAGAVGVECMREKGTGLNPPPNRLHVWWARRPLAVSRAAVMASLLPTNFSKQTFERLMGFWGSSEQLLYAQRQLDYAKAGLGERIKNPHGMRAFQAGVHERDYSAFEKSVKQIWGDGVTVIDPMSGGGSIPLEAARLGIRTIANEYNPVACSILDVTLDLSFRNNILLSPRVRVWIKRLRDRFNGRISRYYPDKGNYSPYTYLFARTVPCPDTGHQTPIVPDWHLLKPKKGRRVVAIPVIDKDNGTWTVDVKDVGKGAGQTSKIPTPTYQRGKGISLFAEGTQLDADYIKSMAQAGKMKSQLYAIAVKTHKRLEFQAPDKIDLAAIKAAEQKLFELTPTWETNNIIPTEEYPHVSSDERPRLYGMPKWSDLFAPRQLLTMGVLVEELNNLKAEILAEEGKEQGETIYKLLVFGMDKYANWNASLASWNAPYATARSVFDRHDFSFKPTFCEMAPCHSGAGLDWALNNVLDAFEKLMELPRASNAAPVEISLGSATHMPQITDRSITAVVVDPPYADNVQYSELADFFYVWMKRTIGKDKPEWFSTYLCDHDEEAVVNISRNRKDGDMKTAEARIRAYEYYDKLMTDSFREAHRILIDDGVLTVMFTHKKQEAWESLFQSLINAGFTITATWPVKTEGEHSLHQAKKNAAQSTVLLVARKRIEGAGKGYFDSTLRKRIREKAASTAQRLKDEGLNPVDQLVGCFGPAMEVFSAYDEVVTDTGEPVSVGKAIDEASEAVSAWRIQQLAERGLEGVEPEGQFYLLCWDVLGAEEFRFNEAKLLGHAVGMDVDQLIVAGLVTRSQEKINILSAKERRRDRKLEPDELIDTLFGEELKSKKRKKSEALKVHPNDPEFRTSLDMCHALALQYSDSGLGAAKALRNRMGWTAESPVARLMAALVNAAPPALQFDRGKTSAGHKFPEFRAWHEMLESLFGIVPAEWKEEFKETQLDAFGG